MSAVSDPAYLPIDLWRAKAVARIYAADIHGWEMEP